MHSFIYLFIYIYIIIIIAEKYIAENQRGLASKCGEKRFLIGQLLQKIDRNRLISDAHFFCFIFRSFRFKNGKTGSRQAYTNATKFDPNKYKLEKERVPEEVIEKMTSLCCRRCCEIINWKLDYGKYEPLQRARKCNICSEKKVSLAYHRICQECAEVNCVCAKCQKPPGVSANTEESDIDDEVESEQKGSELKETSKYSFVDEVGDAQLAHLQGLDRRLLLKRLKQEKFESDQKNLLKLRERERRTVLRNDYSYDNESTSDEEL
eukprot:gene7212-5069_t